VVAIEAARRLIDAGHQANFLGIIDSRRWDLIGSEHGVKFDAAERSANSLPTGATKSAMAYAVEQGWVQLLSLTSVGLSRCSLTLGYKFERPLTRMLRFTAMHRHALKPLDLPTTLFLSDSHWPGEPWDYGWDAICKPLTKVQIGGDHTSILGPEFGGILNYQFWAAMAKSLPTDCPPLQ
jgi:thioesterase domain-containing protein